MTEIIRIGANIATPIGLIGIVCALVFYVLIRVLRHKEIQLAQLPEDKRAQVADEYLSRYGLSAANLTKAQKFELLQQEMNRHDRRFRSIIWVGAGTFVFCLLIVVGAFVYSRQINPTGNGRNATIRLNGLLSSAHAETKDDIFYLHESLAYQNADVGFVMKSPSLPDELLNTIRTDGEVYLLLSDPMRDRLSRFVDQLRLLKEGYKHFAALKRDGIQAGTIRLMLNECTVIEMCLRLERDFQEKRIGQEEHARRFKRAQDYGGLCAITGLPYASGMKAVLQLKCPPLAERERAANAFWIGHELKNCFESVNSKEKLSEVELAQIRRVENRFHRLGVRVSLVFALKDATIGSEKAKKVGLMLASGIDASCGDGSLNTLLFGETLAPAIKEFGLCLVDPAFRRKMVLEKRSCEVIGKTIDRRIAKAMMPDDLKDQWQHIYACAEKGMSVTQTASDWEKGVYKYFADSEFREIEKQQ